MRTATLAALALSLAMLSGRLPGAETTIAVAANFATPMRLLVATYEQDSGHRVRIATGASGALYAQIRQGAPYDAFFSADRAKPELLERAGLAAAGSRFTYAIGRLVLWAPNEVPGEFGVNALTDAANRRIAIANPRLAPYGQAALDTLRHLELDAAVSDKLVYGENVAQAYQFVRTGNAALGFVAAAQVFSDGRLTSGSGWLVPPDHHAPLRQDAVLLDRGADNPAAIGLFAFLQGEHTRQRLASWGYDAPPLDDAPDGQP